MQRVGEALKGAPGLLQVGPWQEEEGDRLMGISVWESRGTFERALEDLGRFGDAGSQDPSRGDWEERPAEEIFAESA